MKTKTFLPIFPGFYNTIFQFDFESLDESDKDKKINYKDYMDHVAKQACKFIESEFSEFINKIEFENVHSPAYYNYSNDSIYCIIDFNEKKVIKFVENHKNEFSQYLKNNFTSRPGFTSFYSNDVKKWDLLESLKHESKCGYIFEFICQILGITDSEMWQEIEFNYYNFVK